MAGVVGQRVQAAPEGRQGRRGGGLALYVRQMFDCTALVVQEAMSGFAGR